VASYQQAVLQANKEAENAIVAFLYYHEQIGYLQQSVQEAGQAARVTQDKYRAGMIDFNRVLTVEQFLIQQQDRLALTRGNLAQSLINLYKALGGGWEIRLAPMLDPFAPVVAASGLPAGAEVIERPMPSARHNQP
jgi:outer membrane protein TolC